MTASHNVRQRIIERNRYRPSNPRKAKRGHLSGWQGRFQPTVKRPGDLIIDERGYCWEVR